MKRTDYELTLPDQLFPTDNDLEIPTLDMDMQAKECQAPFLCFGDSLLCLEAEYFLVFLDEVVRICDLRLND